MRKHSQGNNENEVDNVICKLKHQDILGSTQIRKIGLGTRTKNV